MSFKDTYPDYVAIEEHIRRARVERSLAIAQMLANAIDGALKGFRKLGRAITREASPAPTKVALRGR